MLASGQEDISIPLRSWIDISNIGDCITSHIVETVFGYRPVSSSPDVEHILGVGSIFFLANENSYIWGSGILSDRLPLPAIDASKITALRGRKTAAHLMRSGYHVPDVPFGDPGILVPDVLAHTTRTCLDRREIVFVPHHSKYTSTEYKRFVDSSEIAILDPCTTSLQFIERIRDADIVISESLHGLIFASAFGKKAVWVGDRDADLFKYEDWFTTVDRPPASPLDPLLPIEELVRAATPLRHTINVAELKAAFPHSAAIELPSRGRVDYRTAREHNPFPFFFHDQHRFLKRPAVPALRFFDLAAEVADNIFANWDERPYAVAINHGHGVLPTRHQLARIVDEMDHNQQHQFAAVATIEQVRHAGLEINPLPGGVSWAWGILDDITAVVIRPSGRRFGENHVIFCV